MRTKRYTRRRHVQFSPEQDEYLVRRALEDGSDTPDSIAAYIRKLVDLDRRQHSAPEAEPFAK